jgi:hypothetical protein
MRRGDARYDPGVRSLLVLLAACAPEEDPPLFGMLGVVDDVFESGSTIGLFEVRTPTALTFKLGDGQATPDEFALEFRREPPDDALEPAGFGVAFVGMLPGLATLPDGEVDGNLRLVGMSTNTAVIFKRPGASGPAWLADFPDGFTCGLCLREQQPDGFAPVDCTFVEIEFPFTDRCVW